jgi:outer membrane receptor protein involved in Fe transport
VKTSGVDVEVAYNKPLADLISGLSGDIDLRLLGTWVDEYKESSGANVLDRIGSVDRPDWKLSARASYVNGGLRLYAEDQYVPSLQLDPSYTPQDIAVNRVAAMNVVNLAFGYDLALAGSTKTEVFLNVDNVFNKDPPIVPGGGVNYVQTNSAVYDSMGREYMAGFRVQF